MTYPPLSLRWTKELLRRCTPAEVTVLCVAYGAKQIATRMGLDVSKLLEEQERQGQAVNQ